MAAELFEPQLRKPLEPPQGPWKVPEFVPEMLVGMLPGAGDVMAGMESQRAGQGAVEAYRGGDYGAAFGRLLESLGHGMGALPMIPAMVRAYHGGKVAKEAVANKMRAAFPTHSELPPSTGGQQIAFLFDDGAIIAENIPSHSDMLAKAGLGPDDAEFLNVSGAIRLRGPDNFEIHVPPTTRQLSQMRRIARDYGHATVQVDVIPHGNWDQMKSDAVELHELSDFIKTAFSGVE